MLPMRDQLQQYTDAIIGAYAGNADGFHLEPAPSSNICSSNERYVSCMRRVFHRGEMI